MKKRYKSYMFRPILYRSVTKVSIALTFCLIWHRFLNPSGRFHVMEYPTLVCSVIFFAGAWFNYLKIDGMSIHHLLEEREKKPRKKRHFFHSIVDFADEKIVTFEELDEEDRTICNFISNVILGGLFLIPVIIYYLILV